MAAMTDRLGRCLDVILFLTRIRDGILMSRDEFKDDSRLS